MKDFRPYIKVPRHLSVSTSLRKGMKWQDCLLSITVSSPHWGANGIHTCASEEKLDEHASITHEPLQLYVALTLLT